MNNPDPMSRDPIKIVRESNPSFADEEVDLLDYVEVLVRRRWLVIWGVLVSLLFGVFYQHFSVQHYLTEVYVLPSDERELRLETGEAKLVRRAGPYLEALKGLAIGRSMLNRRIALAPNDGRDSISLRDFFGAEHIKAALAGLTGCSSFSQDDVGVITVGVELENPAIAAQIANAYVDELILLFTAKQKRREDEDLQYIARRMSEVEEELRVAEDSLIIFQRSNVAIQDPVLALRHNYLKNRANFKRSIYTTLLNKYEVARIDARQKSIAFEALNKATASDAVRISASDKPILLICGVVGLLISVVVAFTKEYFVRAHQSGRLEPILKELEKDVVWGKRLIGRRE